MKNIPYTFSTALPLSYESYTQVAGCFCNADGRFLLLKRHNDKPQGGTWCLPAGKMEHGESPIDAVQREVREETGLELCKAELKEVGSFTIEHEKGRIVFHTFAYSLQMMPKLCIDDRESVDFRWVSFDEIETLDLILAGKEVLSHCLAHLSKLPSQSSKLY